MIQETNSRAVLLLPPLPAHYRYLTHQLVSEHRNLESISLGEGEERRTAISLKMINVEKTADTKKKPRVKRPDQPLYVPRHQRMKNQAPDNENSDGATKHETKVKATLKTSDSPKNDIINRENDIINRENDIINREYDIINREYATESNDTKLNKCEPTALSDSNAVPNPTPEKSSSTFNLKHTSVDLITKDFSPKISPKPATCYPSPSRRDDDADDEDSWFSKFAEDGEAVDPRIYEELSEKMGNVSVKNSVINYLEFKTEIDMSDEEFGHLLEIYDFTKELATQDLMLAFKEYQSKGFDIKWVDDTHAIAIFEGKMAASNAFHTFSNPLLKVRPISQASRQTKLKVKKCTEFLLPHRRRPETSAHVARNLLVAALGVKVKISKEQRDVEHKKIAQAREKKRADIKCKQDIWEGSLYS